MLLLHEVVFKPAVLLCSDVLVDVRDVARFDALLAILAVKNLLMLIESKPLLLKPNKVVFPG